MERVLKAEDAKDWVYKGEGAANLILSYHGSSHFWIGKVLRVQKVQMDRTQPANTCAQLSMHEQLLWADMEMLIESESKSKDSLVQSYSAHVMGPLIGAKHIDSGVRVTVSSDFLEQIDKNVQISRLVSRINASKIDLLSDSALLISDHTVFPGNAREGISIAVEIKPKCGFLPHSEFISKENYIKKQVTRYQMLQAYKLHKGEISKISEYDPLDLFSKSKERIRKSINALYFTPQNNFRVFLNGSLIYTDNSNLNYFEELIKSTTGINLPNFLDLISEIIFESNVLGRLLETQKLDYYDIEGAIHAYYDVISQPCLICKNTSDEGLLRNFEFLHNLHMEKKIKIMRDYLVSATAKDCSLMLSFRPRESGAHDSEYGLVHINSIDQVYEYKAYFIDLDMKPLDKMVYYYNMDQEIVNFYKTVGISEKVSDFSVNGEN